MVEEKDAAGGGVSILNMAYQLHLQTQWKV